MGQASDSPATAGDQQGLTARCWGTRGSIPSPGPETAGYGGNTSCVEVSVGGRQLIFDAGTGLRALGEAMTGPSPRDTVIFVTHFHWDHIQGFPFFRPFYDPEARFQIIGPSQQGIDIQTLFAGQMGPIYFPIPYESVLAETEFLQVPDDPWEENGTRVTSMRVRHPSCTMGYRIEHGGQSLVYIPDNELEGSEYPVDGPGWRSHLLDFIGDADVLIHDAMFTEDEYLPREGWGHSTYRATLELAAEAGVKKLLCFHHAPFRCDSELTTLVDRLAALSAELGHTLEVAAATEGAEVFP